MEICQKCGTEIEDEIVYEFDCEFFCEKCYWNIIDSIGDKNAN